MGSSNSVPEDVHVVIVGAGYGGSELALKLLGSRANFTVIDQRDSLHHNVASVRAVAVPDYSQKILIPLEKTFGSKFKKGCVQSVDAKLKKVKLHSGDEITYDILVLATGSRGSFPAKIGDESREEAMVKYNEYAHKVKNSQRVVCVGGGPVGVEIAAEIATEYPEKDVTIIHSGKKLIFESPTDKFHGRLLEILDELKIKVILEEKVANLEIFRDGGSGTVQTVRGTSIDADLVIPSIGISVNSDAYRESIGGGVEPNGSLRVNDCLQLEGEEDIFAIGDCCKSGDAWLAYKAADHAKHVFDNIKRKAAGSPMKPYKPMDRTVGGMMVLSLGRRRGIGQTEGGMMIPEFVCTKLKSSDMFVGKFWGNMKQKVPV